MKRLLPDGMLGSIRGQLYPLRRIAKAPVRGDNSGSSTPNTGMATATATATGLGSGTSLGDGAPTAFQRVQQARRRLSQTLPPGRKVSFLDVPATSSSRKSTPGAWHNLLALTMTLCTKTYNAVCCPSHQE